VEIGQGVPAAVTIGPEAVVIIVRIDLMVETDPIGPMAAIVQIGPTTATDRIVPGAMAGPIIIPTGSTIGTNGTTFDTTTS
jgi:hypothetical protein